MIEPTKPERVVVDRKIGDTFVATTRKMIFADRYNAEGKVIGKGDLLGIEVEDDRHFRFITQPSQLTPVQEKK